MFKLVCKAQNYAWGKIGLDSIVGQIHNTHHPEEEKETNEKPFAELWMGDHTNGPSQFKVDISDDVLMECIGHKEFVTENEGKTVPINKLFALDADKFLGDKYVAKFGNKQLMYLFKVLSVRTALSI